MAWVRVIRVSVSVDKLKPKWCQRSADGGGRDVSSDRARRWHESVPQRTDRSVPPHCVDITLQFMLPSTASSLAEITKIPLYSTYTLKLMIKDN